MKITLKELIKVAENIRKFGIEDDGESLDTVLCEFISVFSSINDYIEANGNVALSCGSEWLFQSDNGQIGALDLVGEIIYGLSDYAKSEEDED